MIEPLTIPTSGPAAGSPAGPEPLVPDCDPNGGTSTSVLERTETTAEVEPGDHERFAHYVRKEKIMQSALSGKPVIALCGKVWVPGRDPKKFPVCPTCKEIYDGLRAPQDGEGDSGK
ncbi:DUF3039 domain-containing protein [Oerskovia enterophila]|uniref:DUF3039 domain-containing protein n=1 Tax=Oerskovia enterophila TaxID=43678 RepID=UPI003817B8A0